MSADTQARETTLAAISANSQAISMNAENITLLRNDVGVLQSDVTTLQQDVTGLQNVVRDHEEQIGINTDGVAVALAMAGVGGLDRGESYALSANWGFYDDANAFAFSGAARVSETMSFNAGLGVGTEHNEVGARAGVRWGW